MLKTALAAIVLTIAAPAFAATITFSSSGLPSDPAAGETVIETFDSALADGYSWNGFNRSLWSSSGNPTGNLFDTGVSGQAGNIPGNDTTFASVFGGQSATLSSERMLTSLSLDIGSIDTYNFIDFYNGEELVATLTGSQLSSNPNGAWTGSDTNRRFFFVGAEFNRITFRSTGNSFEFDNIATTEVSEPAMLGLFGLGLAGLAGLRRRRG